MGGRSETVHALLSSLPADAHRKDPAVALSLAADSIVHGLVDQAAAALAIARHLAPASPAERRGLHDVYAAVIGLELARRRGDLEEAEVMMSDLETALAAAGESHEGPVPPDYRALALMNLGVAELWADRPARAHTNLEAALASARGIPLPFLEVGCLAHLAIVAPLTEQPLPRALELAERAIAIAEEHGWTSEPMTNSAFAAAGLALVWLGRFVEAERQLERGEEALRTAADPGTEVVLRHARGLLSLAQDRPDEAAIEFEQARGAAGLLASGHLLAIDARCRSVQAQIRLGRIDSAQVELEELDPNPDSRAGARITIAALKLASDEPEQVAELLARVIDGSAAAIHGGAARVEALVLDALANDHLGDRGATERSLEAALDLAEPEGLILPFALWPARDLLERHPRHRSAHGALIATILDTLAGRAPARSPAAPLMDELSEAELRIVRYLPSNLTAVEIAGELYVSANTVRTHVRHIYQKLGAHNRSEAVARARELGLIAPQALRR
jgi:LuxR family maltose regulon positive regulatory protein